MLLLFAERDRDGPDDLAGLPELRLHGLSDSDARELLAATNAGPLDQPVRDRIIAETRGNPLALLELPRMFSGGISREDSRCPAACGAKLEASFRGRVAELPEETQRLLLVAAAEPTGDPTLLSRAAAELDVPMSGSRSGGGGRPPRARHASDASPPSFSARRSTAPRPRKSDERPTARWLSRVDPEVDFDRRAWHRAQATPVPDEHVAAELEQSASRARARGGLAAAAAFLERSAALTPAAAPRAARGLAAAEFKHEAGLLDAAERLVREAEYGSLDELQRARAQRLRGRIAFATRGERFSC